MIIKNSDSNLVNPLTMENNFILSHDFIKMINRTLESNGLPPLFNERLLMQFLHKNGWIDDNGIITEEGIRSGMIKQTPPVNLN